jgi:hypothetical protein
MTMHQVEQTDDEREQAQEDAEFQRIERLNAFGQALTRRRKEAVDGRAQSGIEQEWLEDEEFYEGIDDANRGEHQTLKPVNSNGAASAKQQPKRKGSNVFLNITGPYVDFSAGRASDMLLPTDDRAWSIQPTPLPELVDQTENERLITGADGSQKTVGQVAQMMIDEAKIAADKAQKRIEDWHVECQWHAQVREILKDAAKVGVSILKGPYPVKRRARAITRGQDGSVEVKIKQETKPASRRIDYWDFYPDPACGENIQNGSGTWERDRITARQLRDLKNMKDADGNGFYLDSAIDMCLKEGPQKKFEDIHRDTYLDSEQYEIWYYHGTAEAEDLRAAGCECDETKVYDVMVTMVNDRVIKAALSPLDSGEFPYDVMIWKKRAGHWAGIGVARQVRVPQRMINAGTRNMMDNAGLASGPQIVMKRGVVIPADGSYEITPRKVWYVEEDANAQDVREAFMAIDISMLEDRLLKIIQFALKMAEDVTGLPMLMQGQQGSAPDTVGGMTMLQNNAGTPLRAVAKQFDDRVTEPHINRYYEWLLLYGPDKSEKGDFLIDARGSSALFERDAQNQAILAMAPFVKDPAFGLNPKLWMREALAAQRLDPKRFRYTDDEQKQIDEQMQQQPVDPRIEAAKINAQARIHAADRSAEVTKERIAKDTDRDTVYVQAQHARDQTNAQAHMQELQLRRELAMLDYANRQKISLEQVKAGLTETVLKLKTQEKLASVNGKGPQVATPPTEPPGRAPAGEAYQK